MFRLRRSVKRRESRAELALVLFPRPEAVPVDGAVNSQNAVEMIHLVL